MVTLNRSSHINFQEFVLPEVRAPLLAGRNILLVLFAGLFCLPPGGLRLLPLAKFPKRHPIIFGSVFAGVKTGAADILAQKYVECKEKINFLRGGFKSSFFMKYCRVSAPFEVVFFIVVVVVLW